MLPTYLSMASHSVFPVERRYLICDLILEIWRSVTRSREPIRGDSKKKKNLEENKRTGEFRTHNICDAAMTLKLVPGELARLVPRLSILYVLGAPKDGTVES
jgi:hypothetical protein